MWVNWNENPVAATVEDCAIRAVSTALDIEWDEAFDFVADMAKSMGTMPHSNAAWGAVLRQNRFYRAFSRSCPDCPTVAEFAEDHPKGVYVLGLDRHVVTVIDGDWYDIWDCGDEPVIYYWYQKGEENYA